MVTINEYYTKMQKMSKKKYNLWYSQKHVYL